MPEVHKLKFNSRGKNALCAGPSNDLEPKQPTFERSAWLTEVGVNNVADPRSRDRHTNITITACPVLKDGTTCSRSGRPCIKPYVVSSAQLLATAPNESTVTFAPDRDLIISTRNSGLKTNSSSK